MAGAEPTPALRSRGSASRAAAAAVLVLLPAGTPALDAQSVLESLRRGIEAQQAFRRAKAAYDARDYPTARDRFAEVLALHPEHDEARALLGWSHYYLGEHRAAIITFKAVLRRQPAWDGLYEGLGWGRFRLGRHHLASEAFRAALELNPENVDARIGLGSAQFELGAYDAALPHLQAAVKRLDPLAGAGPPELSAARAKLAWSLYYVERYREALVEFEKGLRAAPGLYGLHNGAGWCYLRLGQKERARVAFQRALALKPNYEDALEGLRQTSG